MKTTRRGLFGIFAGALAAPAVAKISPEQGLTGLFAEDSSMYVLGKPSVEFCFPPGYEDAVMHDLERRYLRPASDALANELDAHIAVLNERLATSAVNLSRFPCPIALNEEGRSELVIEWEDEDFA